MARRTKVVVGELIFGVSADMKAFDRSINQMVKRVERIGKRVEAIGAGMVKAFAPATAAIALATRSGLRFANTLQDIADRMDDSARSIQAMRTLADRSGASYERMQKGLTNVLQRTNQAAGGNETYRKAIKDLGLELDSLVKLPVSRRMEEIARAYQNSTDKAKAYNAMTQLVGTFSTPELIVALRKLGADGLDPLIQKYEDLGLLVSDKTTQRLAEAQGVIDHLSKRWQTFSTNIAVQVAPALEKVIAVITILMKRIEEIDPVTLQWAIGITVAGTAIGTMLVVVGKIMGPLAALGGAIVGITAKLAAMTLGWIAATGPIGLTIAAIGAAVAGVLFFTGQLDEAIGLIAGPEMKQAITQLREDFIDAAKAIGEALYEAVHGAIIDAIEASKRSLYTSDIGTVIAGILGIKPNFGGSSRPTEGTTDDGGIPKSIERISRVVKFGESAQNARETFGLFADGIGDRFKEVFASLGVSDWMDKTIKGLGISSDDINSQLDDIKEATDSSANQITSAVDGVTSAITKNPYSKELQEYAKQTLKDIESGRLSTSRQTRLEAQGIVDGRPVDFRTRRFSRFRDEQLEAAARRESEHEEYATPSDPKWISRPGWDDPNAQIFRPGWDNPNMKPTIPNIDPVKLNTSVKHGLDSGGGESTTSMLIQILAAIQTSNGYLEELTT